MSERRSIQEFKVERDEAEDAKSLYDLCGVLIERVEVLEIELGESRRFARRAVELINRIAGGK